MKKFKKHVIIFSVFILLLVSPLTILAHNDAKLSYQKNESYETQSDFSTNTIMNIIKTILRKVLINTIGNIQINDNPAAVYSLTDNSYIAEHGNVKFNSGAIKASVRKDMTAYGQDTINPYMQKNQLFAGNISLLIFNKNGVEVDSASVGSGRTLSYTIPGGYNTRYDGYYIHYVCSNKENWSPRLVYIDNKEPCTIPPCPYSTPTINSGDLDYDSNIVVSDDYIYIKHSNNGDVASKISQSFKKYSTMNDLYNEFYDNSTQKLTNQTKTLTPTDKFVIKDKIVDVDYEDDGDYTVFRFNSTYPEIKYHTIMFNGDLTDNYKIGESLKLKFKLEKTAEINGNIFVELDYNLQTAETGKFPEIEDFIK